MGEQLKPCLQAQAHPARCGCEQRAVLAGQAAPAAVPVNCRQRLAAEGKAFPKSSCAACGQFAPKWRECDAMLAAPAAPEANRPTDSMLDSMRKRGLSIDGDNAYKRDLIDCIIGTLMLGKQGSNPPPAGHWAQQFWEIGRAEAEAQESLCSPAVPAPEAQEAITEHAAHQMGATGAEPTESERLLFEAWMRGHCWAVVGEWDGRTYMAAGERGGLIDPAAMLTRQLWAAWRDRAALAGDSAPPSAEQPDIVKVPRELLGRMYGPDWADAQKAAFELRALLAGGEA